MTGRLLIITGASGVGKSTQSAKIATSLSFDKIVATDTIRETLRTEISQNDNPALHRSSFQPGGANTIEDWKATTIPLDSAIKAIIHREMEIGRDLLIEGVHFVPCSAILNEWRAAGGKACGVVLAIEDADIHAQMIAGRRKHNGRSIRHYLDHIDRIREIQNEMIRLAENNGWFVIDFTKSKDPMGEISSKIQ